MRSLPRRISFLSSSMSNLLVLEARSPSLAEEDGSGAAGVSFTTSISAEGWSLGGGASTALDNSVLSVINAGVPVVVTSGNSNVSLMIELGRWV